jgi:hypothetical protein
MKGLILPQHLVEPQHVEGECFDGKGRLIWFLYFHPGYPELIEYRSKHAT